MATKIIHKKSSVAASVPSAADLAPGELALNLADQKIYSKTTGGTIIEMAPQSGGSTSTITETCKNVSGGSLAIGTPVYASGTAGNAIEVQAARADTAGAMPAIGILADTLANEAEGTLVLTGFIQNVNTSTFSEGDTLYVAATGGLTTTPPTGSGNLIQNIGKVVKVHLSNGSIMVTGAGRANATPNLDDGDIFIGNSSNQATTASLTTEVQTIGDSRYVNTTGDTITSGTNTGLTINHDTFANGLIIHRNHGTFSAAIKFKNNTGDTGILFANDSDQQPIWRKGTSTTAYTIFNDSYHPNADKWTTARTLSLSGDASGSVSWDGSANATLSVTLNDSALDDQYVTVGSRYSGNASNLLAANKASIRLWDVSTASDDPSGSLDGTILTAGWDSISWGNQQYHDFHNNGLYIRNKYNNTWQSWQRVFADSYHPNADKWTTARTLSLSGDASGSVSWDGSANATLSVTVANDSHTHAYNNLTSKGSGTGNYITTGQYRWGSGSGTFSGNPRSAVIGYSGGNYGQIGYGWHPTGTSGVHTSQIADFQSRIDLYDGIVVYGSGSTQAVGSTVSWTELLDCRTGTFQYKNNNIFHDGYHPNADKWTTARTLSLSGDASGSVSWDGSANATLSVTVANDSHSHSNYITSNANDTTSGIITFGPNSTWSKYLKIGGNANNSDANSGSIGVTNGNLHLDAANGAFATYLNYYDGTGGVAFGSGAASVVAWMGPDGDLWKGSADNTGSKYWHAGNDGSGSGLDADLLDGIQASGFLRSNADDSFSGGLVSTARDEGIFGTYDSTKTDHIWSMGTAYKNHASGTNFGNLYGLAYKHTNNTTGGTMASGHQMVWCQNGTPYSAMGTNIWTSGSVIVGGTVDGRDVATDGSKLDGIDANANNYSFPYTVSASASNSTVVQRHSSGYIYANYFNTTPNDIATGSITKIVAESGNDGFMRHATAPAVRSFLNVADGANNYSLPATPSVTSLNLADKITHTGDTDTYFQFHGANLARMVLAGAEVQEWGANYTLFSDNDTVRLGSGSDFRMWFDGSNTYFRNYSHANGDVLFQGEGSDGVNETAMKLDFSGTRSYVNLYENNSLRLNTTDYGINITGDLTATGEVISLSDVNFKENITSIETSAAIAIVNSLRPVSYNMIGEGATNVKVGFIAQEVEKTLPEVVHDNNGVLGVSYGNMIAVLTSALQNALTRIEELENVISNK